MSLANLIKHPTGSLGPGVWKRKGSDEDDEHDDESSRLLKKRRYAWHVTLEGESSDHTEESDDESVYSVQNEETEYCRDTSDTSTSAWINPNDSNMMIGVEYDLATSSDSDNPFLDSSTSDPDEILSVHVLASQSDSDIGSERVEDTDASLTSADSELGKADYWTCGQCNTTNNNPLFRYCERCYQLRKNLFPPRPRGKKSQKSNASEISSQTSTLSRVDSGLDSQPTSQTLSTDPEMSSQPETLSIEDDTANGVYIAGTSGEQKTDNGEDEEFLKKVKLAQARMEFKEDLDNKCCVVCTVVPKNGAFVHGNAAHICCCYQCAVKVWKATKQCPICNRKVTKVVKVFYT